MNDLDKRETPNHEAAPDEATRVDEDLPGDWERTNFRLTGNFKINARFQLTDADDVETIATVKIRPHKSYDDQPGFPNCHVVELADYTVDRDPPAKTRLGGSPSETEYLDDTLDLAVELMTDFLADDGDAGTA
ncbi:MAG: hypothetical protein SV760_00800 [Halobacteria archaeon]|nr:hypothetical protein [Halobacteria archaeon]